MINLDEIVKGHRSNFNELAECFINETVYYSEFEAIDYYTESCSLNELETYTIRDKSFGMILTICGNHIEQLKEMRVDGFLTLYEDDLNETEYNVDLEIPLRTMLTYVIENEEKFR